LEFSDKLASLICAEVYRAFDLDHPELYLVSPELTQVVGNEVKRFICALAGYFASPNPLLSFHQLAEGIKDKNYAAYLKKVRTASLTRAASAYSVADDGLDNYVIPGLKDIGDIFNYRYWIRWVEPDPLDYLYARIPLEDPPDTVKKRWEDCLYDVLPDFLSPVLPEEVLLSVSSSSSITEDGSPSKVFLDKADPSKNYFSKEPLCGKRTVVYKGPCEVRDCVILPISQTNTVKWIEKQMAECAAHTTYSAFGLDPDEFNQTLEDFYDPQCWYFNRDLTKEGLTKPRWFLQSIAKVCKEKFPDNPIWPYFSIYDSFSLRVDGVKETFPRGHGLGMANALTTIMQCATFHYLIAEGELSGDVSALFYNDDATFKGLREDVIISLAEEEDSLIKPLGLIPKDSKTYISKVMVLCERYFPKSINTKDSYGKYVRRLPFSATNIVVAKSIFSMIDDPVYGEFEPSLLPLALSFWGCEWTPAEYDLPWWAGGWVRPRYKGVDLSFLHGWDVDPQLLARGFVVGPPEMKPPVFTKEKGVWVSPANQLTLFDLKHVPPFAREYYELVLPMAKAKAKYHRSGDDKATYAWFRHLLLSRYQAWSTPAKQMSMEDYFGILCKKHPVDFIPPVGQRKMLPGHDVLETSNYVQPVPLKQPNKLLGSLSFWMGTKYFKHVVYYPSVVADRGKGKLDADRLSKFNNSILALPGVVQIPINENYIEIKGALTERNYYDDYAVLEAYTWATSNFEYPRPLTRSRWGDEINKASFFLMEFDKYFNKDSIDFWIKHTRSAVIPLMLGNLPEDIWAQVLDEYCRDGDEIPPSVLNETEQIRKGQPIEDYATAFWNYRDTGIIPPDVPEFVARCWEKGLALFRQQLLWTGIGSMSSTRKVNSIISDGVPVENSAEDLSIRKFTGLVRSEVQGNPVYQLPDLVDRWADSDSEAGGGAFALFDE